MRLIKEFSFNDIKAYQLGWSFAGPPLMTVYCFVFGDVMIDTAQSHMVKEAVAIAGEHGIKSVYLTHHHEDHSGNAAAITQALNTRTYGHPSTVKRMGSSFKILPYQKYMWGKSTPLEMQNVPQTIETVLGDMVPVHTPGHCRDHLVYLLKDRGILFCGDLYLSEKIKYFRANEDMGQQIASLKRLLELDFDMLLCSHHPKHKNGKQYIQRKIEFLEDLYGKIILLWEKGLRAKQIFQVLKLKENYFAKLICFGDVSMINGVRSAIRFHENKKRQI